MTFTPLIWYNEFMRILLKLLSVVVLYASLASAQEYNPYEIGQLGGGLETTSPRSMNESGTIVGVAKTAGGYDRAFVWSKAGGIQDIGTFGGIHAGAHDVNNFGVIVGYRQDADLSSHFWMHDGAFHELAIPATEIADSGAMMYVVDTDPGPYVSRRTYYYDSGGSIDVGDLGGGKTEGYDMNNLGVIVGRSRTADPLWHACVWEQHGGLQEITGGLESAALAITEAGMVVGYIDDDDGIAKNRGWVWDGLSLTFFDPPEGESFVFPSDISASGAVVGQTGQAKGFIWEPGWDAAQILTSPVEGMYIADAKFINDAGGIAAMLQPLDIDPATGEPMNDPAYFLELIPEPATLLLLGIGELGLICRKRRYCLSTPGCR